MSIFTKIFQRFSHVSFKFSIAALVLLLLVNLFLYYNLRYLGYAQNTVSLLQSKQTVLEEEKKTDSHKTNYVEKIKCKISNLTQLYVDKVLQLRDGLGDFYLKAPNSTELMRRCIEFKKTLILDKLSSNLFYSKNHFTNGQLVKLLKNATVLKASNAKKGTQLKLLLQLENNITVIFKPKWYSPHQIIFGSVYSGKDRHYGEVVAFYLSIVMNFPRVPMAAIRKLNINELLLVSDRALLETFISKDNNTCLYGVCPYCSPLDLLCTDSNTLEGSVIVYLSSNYKLKINRHPWGRTYKCETLARWETDENYCTNVQATKFYSNIRNEALFFDLVDASIFDFLIDNGDRHHYEYFEGEEIPRLLMMDNGKSFGNPYVDHIDILAPLYQCCLIRNSTWNTLLNLKGGNLSYWLRYLLNESDSDAVLDEMHFKALDRRLLVIFAVLKDCFLRKKMPNVVLNDEKIFSSYKIVSRFKQNFEMNKP